MYVKEKRVLVVSRMVQSVPSMLNVHFRHVGWKGYT